MPNITEFKSPTGETLPIADTTARAEIGVLQQRADDTDHAMADLDNAVKELQRSGTGGTKVIDLNAFGIDIVTPVLQGGGTISFDINHKEFWESIPINEPFVFMAYTGQAYS